MRVLELGSYVSVAYAGMLLAEQGHEVEKWISPTREDPILGLKEGEKLWEWINYRKNVHEVHAKGVTRLFNGEFDVVIDNVRSTTWQSWGVDPHKEAIRIDCGWVSLRDEFDGRSFDVVAQARAWGDHSPALPFYLGDTAAGLFLAFKASNADRGWHSVIRQASCLAKLVEGELAVPIERKGGQTPWDEPGTYGMRSTETGPVAQVDYRGETIREPIRDARWRWEHLDHNGKGRINI